MGGQYETEVPKAPAKTPAAAGGVGASASTGKIRLHEVNGFVHVHDDDAKLKVVVPVIEFVGQMQRLDDPATREVSMDDVEKNWTTATIRRSGDDVTVTVERRRSVLDTLKGFAKKLK